MATMMINVQQQIITMIRIGNELLLSPSFPFGELLRGATFVGGDVGDRPMLIAPVTGANVDGAVVGAVVMTQSVALQAVHPIGR